MPPLNPRAGYQMTTASLIDNSPSADPQVTSLSTPTARVTAHLTAVDRAARAWLRRHTPVIRQLTDLLRTLPLFAPNSEIHSELAASLLSLLSLYRDLTPDQSLPPVCLTLLSSIQLPLEMLTRRRAGQPSQLRAVTALEAAKLLFRLSLIFSNSRKGRMFTLQSERLPEAPAPPVCTCGLQQVPGSDLVKVTRGRRSGRRVLHPQKNTSKTAHDPLLDALFLVAYERRASWVIRMLVPDVSCEACSEKRVERSGLNGGAGSVARACVALQPAELAAEVIYVARPLIQLLLMRRFGWRSWKPWLAALFLDLGSRVAMAQPQSGEENDEKRRRMAQLVLYLGRSPLFDILIRAFVRKLTSPLRKVPLIGGATSSAIEWATLLQQYWFYTSGS